MTVHVVSYNLLVPVLAEQLEYYYKCQPRFLDTNYRWNLIQFQLRQEIVHNANTIICLQELCRTLLPSMKRFFHQFNYNLYHNLYGQKYNDHMGVAIAIPSSMKVTSISNINIGDELRLLLVEKHANIFALGDILARAFKEKPAQPTSDPWQIAVTKRNILLVVQVLINGKHLCIGTYHMPCLYTRPDVMIIHSSMVKDMMFRLATGQNIILAGDFNTKPWDTSYRAILERGFIRGRLPKSSTYSIHYQPNTEQVLKSAYLEKNGAEPAFTAFSSTPKSPDFCATTDYIFFDGRLIVEKVLPLPNYPTSASYPDAKHPSDHLMIAATFRLF